jgi:uncharacterized protein (DUF2384 family)
VLRRTVRRPLDAHDALVQGRPRAAVDHPVGWLTNLREPGSLDGILGMSLRTFQSRRDAGSMPLSHEQSGPVTNFPAGDASRTSLVDPRPGEDDLGWLSASAAASLDG